ncbi:GNAT family N-acetyltransferase [Paenibacillus sp. BAC0078]
MITLEPVADPLSSESIELQAAILNSQPAFNLMVLHKEALTAEEIREENRQNLEMNEKMLFIKENNQYIGIVTYLPNNPSDNVPWIGLFILHRSYAGQGIGSIAVNVLERHLKQNNVTSARLAVQLENEIGALFWTRNGFIKTSSNRDQHGNKVDVYEKQFA